MALVLANRLSSKSGASQVQGTRRFNGTRPSSIHARGNATNAAAVMEWWWLGRLVGVSGGGVGESSRKVQNLDPAVSPQLTTCLNHRGRGTLGSRRVKYGLRRSACEEELRLVVEQNQWLATVNLSALGPIVAIVQADHEVDIACPLQDGCKMMARNRELDGA